MGVRQYVFVVDWRLRNGQVDLVDSVGTASTRRRLWFVAAVSALVLVAAFLASGPSPPRKIVMAGGQADGVYSAVANSYRARLKRAGLDAQVVVTNGSVDNLERLLRREVDVALAQGGTYPLVRDPGGRLRGLAALYFEPLWVFYRDLPMTSLAALEGRRVSVGPSGSGTEAVAKKLLREYGIEDGPLVANLSNAEARGRLERGDLDAAFFVTSYRDPSVLELLRRPDVQLLSFRREIAHTRTFAALQPLKLPEGVIDLRNNVPSEDKTLLAAAALLVSRDDLHPRVVEQLLKVAHTVHRSGSLLDPPLRFPTLEGVDLPPHEAAEVYLTQGESFLSRTLPYPMLRWALILRLLVLPLIVWLPFVRLLPEVTKWKVDRRFARLYATLQSIEHGVLTAESPEELREQIRRLDRLAAATPELCRHVPPSRRSDIYHWRHHIAFVRGDAAARLAGAETRESARH